MGNELENKAGNANEADNAPLLKKWNAPQLTAVSIAELTQHQMWGGSDGVATSSLS